MSSGQRTRIRLSPGNLFACSCKAATRLLTAAHKGLPGPAPAPPPRLPAGGGQDPDPPSLHLAPCFFILLAQPRGVPRLQVRAPQGQKGSSAAFLEGTPRKAPPTRVSQGKGSPRAVYGVFRPPVVLLVVFPPYPLSDAQTSKLVTFGARALGSGHLRYLQPPGAAWRASSTSACLLGPPSTSG